MFVRKNDTTFYCDFSLAFCESNAMDHITCMCRTTGISSRGDGTIIRYNYIEEAAGAGVRLGGAEVDGYQYGVNNEVRMTRCRTR